MPSYLHRVLPGGDEWDTDRKAGHPILAMRLTRFARDKLTGQFLWKDGVRHDTDTVPLRDGAPFQGSLVFRLQGSPPSTANSDDYVWIGLEMLVPSVVPGLVPGESAVLLNEEDLLPTDMSIRVDSDSYQLPIEDPVRFYRFIWELNRHKAVRL